MLLNLRIYNNKDRLNGILSIFDINYSDRLAIIMSMDRFRQPEWSLQEPATASD